MNNFIYNIGLIKMAGINGLSIEPNVTFPGIDSRDIGKVASDYLAQLNFRGKTIHYLQGPRAYMMNEVTSVSGNSIGNPSFTLLEISRIDPDPGAQTFRNYIE